MMADGTDSGDRMTRDVRWILLSNANIGELKRIAAGSHGRPTPKLRRQLVAATGEEPIRSTSVQLRSGRFAAVPVNVDVLAALFVGDAQTRRATAATLAELAIGRMKLGVARPEEVLPAANVARKPFTAPSIRSVVRGGAPDSSRRRH